MTQTSVSKAVALRNDGAKAIIDEYRDDLAAVMPSHMNPEVFTRLSISVLSRDEKLMRAAQNNPASLLSALWEASRLGLCPGSEQYYLTSRKGEIVGITGYQGEIELIYRAGAVSSVICEVVRENDVFVWKQGSLDDHRPPRWNGPQTQPFHEVDWFSDRGDLKGVYAYAVMKDGAISKVVVLNRQHIEKAKSFSAGLSTDWSPWKVHEESMWLKTAAHRLRKWVPTSAEYMREQLRAISDVQAERSDSRPQMPAQRAASPVEQLAADDFRAMADEASTMQELTQALGAAQRAGFAQQGDDLFQHFLARKSAIEAQAAGADEVVLAHAHEGDYDANCEACQKERAEADQLMAGAA